MKPLSLPVLAALLVSGCVLPDLSTSGSPSPSVTALDSKMVDALRSVRTYNFSTDLTQTLTLLSSTGTPKESPVQLSMSIWGSVDLPGEKAVLQSQISSLGRSVDVFTYLVGDFLYAWESSSKTWVKQRMGPAEKATFLRQADALNNSRELLNISKIGRKGPGESGTYYVYLSPDKQELRNVLSAQLQSAGSGSSSIVPSVEKVLAGLESAEGIYWIFEESSLPSSGKFNYSFRIPNETTGETVKVDVRTNTWYKDYNQAPPVVLPTGAEGAQEVSSSTGSPGATPRGGPAFRFAAPDTLTATAGKWFKYSFCDPEPATNTSACGPIPATTNPSGGSPPYHFVLGSGTGFPPFGLSLGKDGLLQGTVDKSEAGKTRTIRVCAVDLKADSVCREVFIIVEDAPPSPTPTPDWDQYCRTNYPGSVYDPATNTCIAASTPTPTVTTRERPAISIQSATCVVRERFSWGTPISFTVEMSGSASGPVGTALSLNYADLVRDCGAWGSNCERDAGEPASASWTTQGNGASGARVQVSNSACYGGCASAQTPAGVVCPTN